MKMTQSLKKYITILYVHSIFQAFFKIYITLIIHVLRTGYFIQKQCILFNSIVGPLFNAVGRIYWCDGVLGTISSMNRDGTDRRLVASQSGSRFYDIILVHETLFVVTSDSSRRLVIVIELCFICERFIVNVF